MKLTQLNEKMPAWFAAEAIMAGCVTAVREHGLHTVMYKGTVMRSGPFRSLLPTTVNAAFTQ